MSRQYRFTFPLKPIALGILISIGMAPGSGFTQEVNIVAKSKTATGVITTERYRPFSTVAASLPPGAAPANSWVYLNTDNLTANTDIRATQRSLGFREVDYKAFVSAALTLAPVTPTTASGITTYDYTAQNNEKANLVAFWKEKDLPIIIGPDGKAYITDGHHTTAGYLAAVTAAREIVPGQGHVVLGHIVASYYTGTPTAPTDSFWTTLQSNNNAFLYVTGGNQLTTPADAGYTGLQPILPSVQPMPTVPGKSSMTNDDYRSLGWGMADGIVKGQLVGAGSFDSALKGFKKANPLTSAAYPALNTCAVPGECDINFVEFYWSDFLRNRVVWDNTKSGNSLITGGANANLISAPVAFFAAVANGVALSKSELYRDQYGRNLIDYTGAAFSKNTRTWAQASLNNVLAKAGEKYHMYLLDDSTVQGDILPSAKSTNYLHIDTTAGQTVSGAVRNFAQVDINRGAQIQTNWKDASALSTYLGYQSNSILTIAPGTGTVTFTGASSNLGNVTVWGGGVVIGSTGSIASTTSLTVNTGASLANKGSISVGSFTQQAGATLSVQPNVSSQIGTLAVTGTASLNGTLNIGTGAGKWTTNSPYTVLTAGTVSGTFANTTTTTALLTSKLTYNTGNVQLTMQPNTAALVAAATPKGAGVAASLQAIAGGTPTGPMKTLVDNVFNLSPADAAKTLESLKGTSLTSVSTVSQSINSGLTRAITSRLSVGGGSAVGRGGLAYSNLKLTALDTGNNGASDVTQPITGLAAGDETAMGRGLWIRPMGMEGDTRGDANATGFRTHTAGLIMGFDADLDPTKVIGVSLGYTSTNVGFDGNSDSTKVRSPLVALYGSLNKGPWTYKGVLSYADNRYSGTRYIDLGGTTSVASSNFSGRQFSLYGEAAYAIPQGNLTIEPVAALLWSRLRQDAFTESGAGGANLAVAAQTNTIVTSSLGARFDWKLDDKGQIELRSFWNHDFGDVNPSSSAQFYAAPVGGAFTVSGVQLKRDALLLGAGISTEARKNLKLSLDYNAEARDHQTNQSLIAGLSYSW